MPERAREPGPAGSAASKRASPWSVFAFRDFSMLWLGGVTMMVTMQMRQFVSTFWLFDETGTEAALGFLGLIQLVQMPIALYGGALADVIDRKKLMAMTQTVSFGSLLLLTLAAVAGVLAPWHFYVLTGVTGVVNMLGNAARPAMLSRVVPKSHITHAVTVNTATSQIAGMIAPLLSGVMYEQFGVTVSLITTTVIAGMSVMTPLLIRVSGAPEGGSRRVTVQTLMEGFTFVRHHRILPGLYLLDIGVTVVSFYRMLFIIFAVDLYGMAETAAGALGTANSLGGMLGSMMVFLTTRVQRKGVMVLAATLVYAGLLIAFGLTPIFWVGLIIVAGLGAMDSIGMTMRQAIVQLTTPDALLGRASSAHSFSAMTANNIGQAEVSFVSAAIGGGPTMVLGGVVSLAVVGLIWWVVPGIRRYRYSESAELRAEAAPVAGSGADPRTTKLPQSPRSG